MKIVRQNFSLIELLVVIAIISILTSILLPGLKKARDMSKRIDCLSQHKQLVSAALCYVNDQNGFVCPCSLTGMTEYDRWNYNLAPYVPALFVWKGEGCLDYSGGTYPTCPSASPPSKEGWHPTQGAWGHSDYGQNSYFGYNGGSYPQDTIHRLISVKRPSKTVMFNDTTKSYRALPTDHASQKMSFRHSGRSNFGFVDGHADCLTHPLGLNYAHTDKPYWHPDGNM